MIGGRRRPASRPSRRRCFLASSRVEPLTERTPSSSSRSPRRGPARAAALARLADPDDGVRRVVGGGLVAGVAGRPGDGAGGGGGCRASPSPVVVRVLGARRRRRVLGVGVLGRRRPRPPARSSSLLAVLRPRPRPRRPRPPRRRRRVPPSPSSASSASCRAVPRLVARRPRRRWSARSAAVPRLGRRAAAAGRRGDRRPGAGTAGRARARRRPARRRPRRRRIASLGRLGRSSGAPRPSCVVRLRVAFLAGGGGSVGRRRRRPVRPRPSAAAAASAGCAFLAGACGWPSSAAAGRRLRAASVPATRRRARLPRPALGGPAGRLARAGGGAARRGCRLPVGRCWSGWWRRCRRRWARCRASGCSPVTLPGAGCGAGAVGGPARPLAAPHGGCRVCPPAARADVAAKSGGAPSRLAAGSALQSRQAPTTSRSGASGSDTVPAASSSGPCASRVTAGVDRRRQVADVTESGEDIVGSDGRCDVPYDQSKYRTRTRPPAVGTRGSRGDAPGDHRRPGVEGPHARSWSSGHLDPLGGEERRRRRPRGLGRLHARQQDLPHRGLQPVGQARPDVRRRAPRPRSITSRSAGSDASSAARSRSGSQRSATAISRYSASLAHAGRRRAGVARPSGAARTRRSTPSARRPGAAPARRRAGSRGGWRSAAGRAWRSAPAAAARPAAAVRARSAGGHMTPALATLRRGPEPSTVSGSSVSPVGPIWMSVPICGQTPQSKHGVQRQSSTSTPVTRVLPVLPQPVAVQAGVEVVPRAAPRRTRARAWCTSRRRPARRPAPCRRSRIQRSKEKCSLQPSKRPPSSQTASMTLPTRRSPRESSPSTMPGLPSW